MKHESDVSIIVNFDRYQHLLDIEKRYTENGVTIYGNSKYMATIDLTVYTVDNAVAQLAKVLEKQIFENKNLEKSNEALCIENEKLKSQIHYWQFLEKEAEKRETKHRKRT